MTTAARAATGMVSSSPVPKKRTTAITTAATTPVNCVRLPAASATGVRDELLEVGKPWKRPVARLAIASPPSSRL